jgi:hypothetical protein
MISVACNSSRSYLAYDRCGLAAHRPLNRVKSDTPKAYTACSFSRNVSNATLRCHIGFCTSRSRALPRISTFCSHSVSSSWKRSVSPKLFTAGGWRGSSRTADPVSFPALDSRDSAQRFLAFRRRLWRATPGATARPRTGVATRRTASAARPFSGSRRPIDLRGTCSARRPPIVCSRQPTSCGTVGSGS